jgi:hypothetical protein
LLNLGGATFFAARYVRIRDRRLGIMNVAFKFLIFVYVVIYNVIILQGYKAQGEVVGTARFQPRAADISFQRPPSLHRYCKVPGRSSYNSSDGRLFDLPTFPCRYLDTYDSVYPPIESEALFVSTRVNDTMQRLPSNCQNLPVPSCTYKSYSLDTYFVPEIELVTVLMDHTMSVPSLNISKSSLEMSGMILGPDLDPSRPIDPCALYNRYEIPCPTLASTNGSYAIAFGTDGLPDIVALGTLLEAAGVLSLDTVSGTAAKFNSETFRYNGIMLIVTINYNNYFSYNQSAVQYIMSVQEVENADFKAEEVVPGPGVDNSTRQIISRHGIRIVVTQGGRIGQFAVGTLLIVLVTSMGLLAVSASIVDTVALSFLKMRHIYSQYRTVTVSVLWVVCTLSAWLNGGAQSVDFSDISGMKQSDLNRFAAEDLINPRPAIFEQVGQGAGVAIGEGQPRQIVAAPKPTKAAGYFADGKKSPIDGAVEADSDGEDDDDTSQSTTNPVRLAPDIAWGRSGGAAAAASRSR